MPITRVAAYREVKNKLIDALFDKKINKKQYCYIDDYLRDMRYLGDYTGLE